MGDKSMLYNSKGVFDAGATVVGNKAYNLSLLRYSAGIECVPECLSLSFDMVCKDDVIEKAIKEVSCVFCYPVIARSSTNVEDSVVSYAGMFVSKICSNESELKDAIIEIFNSPKSEHIQEYSKRKGIDPSTIKVSVLFQSYITADLSGVLFTKNPLNNDASEVIVEYKENTNDAVTSGCMKTQMLIFKKNEENKCEWPFNELIQIGQQAEAFFCFSVDIEWVVCKSKLWIVQVRKITA